MGENRVGTVIGQHWVGRMKTSLNQIRSRAATLAVALVKCFVFLAACVIVPQVFAGKTVVVTLPSGVTGVEIQRALDQLPAAGGEVVLPAGVFEVREPIVLQRDHQTLRGSGTATILRLVDGANCPVIIMGEPVNDPQRTVRHLRLSSLSVDGNRSHEDRELWRLKGEGSEIRNNGVTIQDVSDSVVEHVTCAHCRSGGLVTTLGVERLAVLDLTAFDNEFDGLACYQTHDCTFTKLDLYNNPGAGISLDLDFDNNVISNAVLIDNDLGIFMRASSNNRFYNVSICDSHHYGVFMARTDTLTLHGWRPVPGTDCVHNSFTNLIASNCGGAAFRVNDTTCTNNVIIGAQFHNGKEGGLSLVRPGLAILQ